MDVVIKEHLIKIDGQKFQTLVGLLLVDGNPYPLNPEYPKEDWRRYYLTGQSYYSLESNIINRYNHIQRLNSNLTIDNVLDYRELDWHGTENKAIADRKKEQRRVRSYQRQTQAIKAWKERKVK